MTAVEPTVYECDATGERFEDPDALLEFGARRAARDPRDGEVSERTLRVSEAALEERVDGAVPRRLEWVGVARAPSGQRVTGAVIPTGRRTGETAVFRERGNVVMARYEAFFGFLEEEVLR